LDADHPTNRVPIPRLFTTNLFPPHPRRHRDRRLTPNLATVPLREAQTIETTHFPDRHFWQRGYDKACLCRLLDATSHTCSQDLGGRQAAREGCIDAGARPAPAEARSYPYSTTGKGAATTPIRLNRTAPCGVQLVRAACFWVSAVTRHTVLPTSSATISAPVLSSATATGRPRAWPSLSRNPVTMSSAMPFGLALTQQSCHQPPLCLAAPPS